MIFEKWCIANRVSELPAEPEDVSRFIAANYSLGAEQLWQLIRKISETHIAAGLPDPVIAPRSWSKEERVLFFELPFKFQLIIWRREAQREAVLLRALNDAAIARKEFAAIQQSKVTNGNTTHRAA